MELPLPRRGAGRPRLIVAAILAFLLLFFSRAICSLIIDYLWWGEMGQVETWIRGSVYRYATNFAEWLIVFVILWWAHARGMKYAGTSLREYPIYARLSTLAFVFVSLFVMAAAMDGWTVARYVAGSGLDTPWRDPVFDRSLSFYFFELPFYNKLVGFLETCTALGAIVYYVTARAWQLRHRLPGFQVGAELDWAEFRQLGKLEAGMFQSLVAFFLLFLAANFWLGRFDLLYSDHGNLLVGIDYVQQHVGLPLQNLKAGAAILAAILVLARRPKLAIACAVVILVDIAVPPLLSGLYVRPNELALEKPFIERHLEATRAAFGLDRRSSEKEFPAHKEGKIDFNRNKAMLDNVRLWDWRAFHDTLSQSQPLRPYAYSDTDVDRYKIDGQLRQVLLAPRELDLNQLGDARNRWINANLTFTHGYGLVLAEASRITPQGLPELLIKDAPLEVATPSLKINRPEIYFGETAHEPIFGRTKQPEFNYPSGSSEVSTTYEGTGGFPLPSTAQRLVAAIAEGDWNIILSNALTPDSRMMIHRSITDRLNTLAEFITWDADPYMVIADSGKLTWIVDGYMVSGLHPYARPVVLADGSEYNYIRNSVKATVDAYDGTVKLYVFDEEDPLVRAYQKLFPALFTAASEMPADLRAHTRAPETLFRVQAEMYRTYHMRDPESYYNRADLWDLATSTSGQASGAQSVTPTYMVATLPGETQPEFLLTIPFTPRNKQNLIGMMVARCDGPHLGEVVHLQLPKQEIIPGPLQIEALINQDQVISKDLTLWNQQGSQVLRSQILTLPIDQTFLFVAPIYIQAAEARMPQLKKVALAVGSTLIYEDTYEQALADLEAVQRGKPLPGGSTTSPVNGTTEASKPPVTESRNDTRTDPRIGAIRSHLQRYRDLTSQGKLSEAGKELGAIESTVKQ